MESSSIPLSTQIDSYIVGGNLSPQILNLIVYLVTDPKGVAFIIRTNGDGANLILSRIRDKGHATWCH